MFAEFVVKPGGDVQPDLVRAITADDIERGFDLAGFDRLRVFFGAGTVLRTGAIEVVTCALITNPAAVLEDRAGIGVIAQIEEVAVDHFDAVVGIVVDAAVQIRLRQHETFGGELAAEQAVDARDELLSHLGLAVLRQRHQDAPALLGAGNVRWRRVDDAADSGLEDGCKRGVERYLARIVLDLDAADLQDVFIGAEAVLFALLVSKERKFQPRQLPLAGGGLIAGYARPVAAG